MASHVQLQPAKSTLPLQWPWPLPDGITFAICCIAGREASASLRIALGKRQSASAPKEATFYEPFTYWDWHGVPTDDEHAREKSQRLWEYRRGFQFNGKILGYPTPKERWSVFKAQIEKYPKRAEWVLRIAVAHWMQPEDMIWIVTHLRSLRELDLSDTPRMENPNHKLWPEYFTGTPNEGMSPPEDMHNFLQKLEWLGLLDPRSSSLILSVLPKCVNLQTLSIRGQYEKESQLHPSKKLSNISGFIHPIAELSPSTVVALELRLSFPWLDRLTQGLKASESSIRYIGIDIGAWIQVYSGQNLFNQGISEKELEAAAHVAALKDRQDAYEKEHNETYAQNCRWWLPKSQYDNDYTNGENFKGSDSDANMSEAGIVEDSGAVDSLYGSLYGMHKRAIADIDFSYYAIKSEKQAKSSNTVDPLILLDAPSAAGSLSNPLYQSRFSRIYAWLHTAFQWRPIFDWDGFMGTELRNNDSALISMETHFRLLKEAGIPIHLFIGRRQQDESSLCWGSQHSSDSWPQTLEEQFNCNLESIAPLVDTLSIVYDLGNPLGKDRLAQIDSLEPYYPPAAVCPRMVCPWKGNGSCPFERQWERPSPPKHRKLPMRGNRTAEPRPIKLQPPLANSDSPIYETGEYADINASDFSISDEDDWPATINHLARLTAYMREAANWQRFWGTYATCFTALTKLDLRMPRCFDRVGSVKLAKILSPTRGWILTTYASERQHVQTNDNKNLTLKTKTWPSGVFVRRSWTRMNNSITISTSGNEAGEELSTISEENKSIDGNNEKVEEQHDRDLLDKAIERAAEAAMLEKEREKELIGEQPHPYTESALTTVVDTSSSKIEQLLKGVYGQRMQNHAEQAWRQRMQDYIEELKEYESKRDDATSFTEGVDIRLSIKEKDAIIALLQRARRNLEHRAQVFQPQNVFTVCEKVEQGSLHREIALVDYQQILGDQKERMMAAQKLSIFETGQSSDAPSVAEPVLENLSDQSRGIPDVAESEREVQLSVIEAEHKIPDENDDLHDSPSPRPIIEMDRLDSKLLEPGVKKEEGDPDLMKDLRGSPLTPQDEAVYGTSEYAQYDNSAELVVDEGDGEPEHKDPKTFEAREAIQIVEVVQTQIVKEYEESTDIITNPQTENTAESTQPTQPETTPPTPANPEPSPPLKKPEQPKKRKATTLNPIDNLPPSRNTRSRTATPGSRHSTPNYKEAHTSDSDGQLPRKKKAKKAVKNAKKQKNPKQKVAEEDEIEPAAAKKKATRTRGKKRAADNEAEGSAAPAAKKRAGRGKAGKSGSS